MAMKKILLALSMVALLVACDSGEKQQVQNSKNGLEIKELNTNSPDCDQYVLMSTSHGDIKIKLYREAPMHRKNFINLVMNGYYDGQIFYRVDPGSYFLYKCLKICSNFKFDLINIFLKFLSSRIVERTN